MPMKKETIKKILRKEIKKLKIKNPDLDLKISTYLKAINKSYIPSYSEYKNWILSQIQKKQGKVVTENTLPDHNIEYDSSISSSEIKKNTKEEEKEISPIQKYWQDVKAGKIKRKGWKDEKPLSLREEELKKELPSKNKIENVKIENQSIKQKQEDLDLKSKLRDSATIETTLGNNISAPNYVNNPKTSELNSKKENLFISKENPSNLKEKNNFVQNFSNPINLNIKPIYIVYGILGIITIFILIKFIKKRENTNSVPQNFETPQIKKKYQNYYDYIQKTKKA